MNQLKNILIATDFSPSANAAFEQATRMAFANQARLHVIHAIDSRVAFDLVELLDESTTEIRNQLVSNARVEIENLLKSFGIDAAIEVKIGTPIEIVVSHAQKINADLLVVGERSGTEDQSPAGVLATRCLRKGPPKVMLVEPNSKGPFERVLACIDFSESSKIVLDQAKRIASQNSSQIRILNVFDFPWKRLGSGSSLKEPTEAQQRTYIDGLRQRLNGYSEYLEGIPYDCHLYHHEYSGHGIAEAAREWNADLIILGKRGHSKWAQMMLGSTAESLVREPNCSVLAVSHPGSDRRQNS